MTKWGVLAYTDVCKNTGVCNKILKVSDDGRIWHFLNLPIFWVLLKPQYLGSSSRFDTSLIRGRSDWAFILFLPEDGSKDDFQNVLVLITSRRLSP